MHSLKLLLGIAIGALPYCLAETSREAPFRKLPMLTVDDAVARPLPLGFTSRSLLPWDGPGKPPVIVITNHAPYFSERSLVYRAAGNDRSDQPFSLPPDYPAYRSEPFAKLFKEKDHALEPDRHLPITRPDGLFDLIRAGTFDYYRNVGEPGSPKFIHDHKIRETEPRKEGSQIWIGDLNGDDVPDLLVAGLLQWSERFAQYPDHPREGGPWSGKEHPNMGSLPDTDIQNFRGYDIAGNWLGHPVRKYLWWARGSRDDKSRISFGPHKQVRYGETDYPVQWQNMGDSMSPAVMDLENGRHIILLAGPDEVLCLPLRGERDGELRTGKAVPFLKNGVRLESANLPFIVGTGDMNGDGKDELVIGSGANGRLTVLAGTRAGEFSELGNVFSLGGGVAGDTLTVPVRIDWDCDGHPDLILGDASGMLSFWKGTTDPLRYASCDFFHTASAPIRHRPTDENLQGEVESAWSYIQPEVFDWDNDGNLDIITNDNEAKLFLYRGNGPGMQLHERQRFMLGERPLPLAWRSRPAVLDGRHKLAGDDRPCLIFMTWDGDLAWTAPRQRGSLEMERVTRLTYEGGEAIRLSNPSGLSGRIKFSITDWDGDGTWDLLLGVQHGLQSAFRSPGTESPSSAPYWLRNAGTNSNPAFEPARMITFKDGTPIRVKSHSFDAFPTDLGGDGKPDIIFGDDEGFVFHLSRDQLKWDESVEETRRAMSREADVRKRNAPLTRGIICEENWDYPQGPIAPETSSGGTGWDGGWKISGSYGVIHHLPSDSRSPFARFSQGGHARISGTGESHVFLRRALESPFNLRQQKPVTLELSASWQREDPADNLGNEDIILLDLISATGRSRFSIGTDSKEQLRITAGDRVLAIPSISSGFQGSRTLRCEIALNPGEPARIRVKISDKAIPETIDKWDIDIREDLEGMVSTIGMSTQRYAGMISVDGIRIESK